MNSSAVATPRFTRRWWIDAPGTAVLLGTAAYVVASTLELIVVHHMPIPFWDQWQQLLPEKYLQQPLSQHNEHRILFGRLFFALDTWFFGGQGHFSIGVVVVSLLATAALIALASARGSWGKRTAVPVFALCTTLFLASYSWDCFLFSFQASYVGVLPFSVAAFVALSSNHRASLAIAAACAFVATYSLANGVFVAPLVTIQALLARRSRHDVITLAFLSVVLLGAYLFGYQRPGHHADPLASLKSPVAVFRYMTAYLGGPLSWRFAEDRLRAANGIGMVALAAWLAVVVMTLVQRKKLQPRDLPLRTTMTFAVACAFVTALGRSNFPLDFAFASRYGSHALLFWCALGGEVFRAARPTGARLAAGVLAILMAGELAYEQSDHERFAVGFVNQFRSAETALVTGALEKALIEKISPSPELVLSALPELRRRRLNVFREPWVDWLGKPLPARRKKSNNKKCVGYFDAARPVRALGAPAFRVRGWAYSYRDARPVERVAIVDEEGIVVGLALGGEPRADVPKVRPDVSSDLTGFVGHIGALGEGAEKVRAYAILDGGRTACALQPEVKLQHEKARRLAR